MKPLFLFILLASTFSPKAQILKLTGAVAVKGSGISLAGASIRLHASSPATVTDRKGLFTFNLPDSNATSLVVSYTGYHTDTIPLTPGQTHYHIYLSPINDQLNEVVVTGTLKEMSRAESPVPVDIITPKFFLKNPTPSLFEAIGMVNGVQPQLNCNVCNTGDIHINGMEGPYTMILIDGMPIVSALSTVYGLNGIPNSMVERIEIIKGPASSLYGSEAMGGIINVITKNPAKAPLISADLFATGWGEISADLSVKFKTGTSTSLLGINYFNYQYPIDNNKDNFTDVTLQGRMSVFNKWSFSRKNARLASIAARFVHEDRWGGEMNWNKSWRGSDSIYGESIYTKRAEIIGLYQLPFREKIFAQFSYNWHNQNSYYGAIPYMANQQVVFIQTYWDKSLGEKNSFLLGAALRYTYYDDNTPGTASPNGTINAPMKTPLPGIFVQDEWTINSKHKLLAGYRYDYDKYHGSVHSPRIAYKYAPDRNNIIRASFGTGFRVVNLFTEDHAALTGAREVVIVEALKPERSYNTNLNYVLKVPLNRSFMGFDLSVFYSYFTNKITGDFDTDPNKIIYKNLNGYAISKGVSLNTDFSFGMPLKILAGITYLDVYQIQRRNSGIQQKSRQLHAPTWSGNYVISYTAPKKITIDITGKWDGPMRLPILPNDYRPEYSPWFTILNIQLSKKFNTGIEVYGGIKNLFNFVPADPILRAFDPFDKTAADPVSNPNGYTFDPSYNYASMQGIRAFAGIRYSLFR